MTPRVYSVATNDKLYVFRDKGGGSTGTIFKWFNNILVYTVFLEELFLKIKWKYSLDLVPTYHKMHDMWELIRICSIPCILGLQIQICGHQFESVATGHNNYVPIYRNRISILATHVPTDSSVFSQIQICSHRLESFSTYYVRKPALKRVEMPSQII